MSEKEIDLKLLKAAVNNILDHLIEDLSLEKVAINEEKDFYWDLCDPELYEVSTRPGELLLGRISDDFDFVKLVRRGQSFDAS
jgi:hypothetical protein